MNMNSFRIGDRVTTTGAGESGVVIGLAVSTLGGGETPMAQVKFDREGLNYGCEGPQAGQWVEEQFLGLERVKNCPMPRGQVARDENGNPTDYSGQNVFGFACPKNSFADVSPRTAPNS